MIAGSGTLGWDITSSNLVERSENVLVVNTGYFGDSFAACLETYGARVTQVKAAMVGDRPSLEEIEQALEQDTYKLVTITHVDTSTGVINDVQRIAQLVRRVSPQTLVVVDGVCSVGCEDLQFDAWDLDLVLTASQKAIGCPPGLSIVFVSGRALDVVRNRSTPPSSYYASIANWLPIMQSYESRKPAYFATPPTQLVHALHTTLKAITVNLEDRFAQHARVSDKIKSAISALGLSQVASKKELQAHGMTAIYLPRGIQPSDILPALLAKSNVVFAGGLLKDVPLPYIRFGHMGVSVTDPDRMDIARALAGLSEAITDLKRAKGL